MNLGSGVSWRELVNIRTHLITQGGWEEEDESKRHENHKMSKVDPVSSWTREKMGDGMSGHEKCRNGRDQKSSPYIWG